MGPLLNIFAAFSALLSAGLLFVGLVSPVGFSESIVTAALIFTLLPAWRVVAWYSRDVEELRRLDHGLCKGCGYDLQGITGHCPECGRPFREHENAKLRKPPGPTTTRH